MYDPLMNDILAKLNSVEKSSTPKRTSVNQESGNEMLDILKRFHLAESGEGKLTPVNVKHGLNAQQKSVGQVGPEFKPKTTKVLTAPTDPKNPFAGKLVGSSESKKNKKSMIDEAEVSEDLLSDIKKSLSDYIKQIDDIEKVDTDLKKKDKKDTDLKKKEKRDRDLVVRKVKEDPTQENPTIQPKPASLTDPTYANSDAMQTPTIDTDSSQGIQPVAETLNNPGDLKVLKNEIDNVVYGSSFGDPNDPQTLRISFKGNEGNWNLRFSVNGNLGITGGGDAFQVFSTVFEAMKKFLKSKQGRKAKSIYFTAKEPSRIKLYDRIAKMVTTQLGLKRTPSSYAGMSMYQFEIPRREQATTTMKSSKKPTIDTDSSQGIQPVAETIPRSFTSVKTHECNGKVFEVVEDERGGFNIRHNNKISPSRFKTFLEADTALQLFTHRLSSTGDYREER